MLADARDANEYIHHATFLCACHTILKQIGAVLDAKALAPFLEYPEVLGLAEVMNYQAVASNEQTIIDKLQLMHQKNKNRWSRREESAGDDKRLFNCGHSDRPRSNDRQEAEERLALGMYLMVREGTVAKDLQALLLLSHQTIPSLFIRD